MNPTSTWELFKFIMFNISFIYENDQQCCNMFLKQKLVINFSSTVKAQGGVIGRDIFLFLEKSNGIIV